VEEVGTLKIKELLGNLIRDKEAIVVVWVSCLMLVL
jgi:hypothetical protein